MTDERIKRKILRAQEKATLWHPAFGSLMSYLRFRESQSVLSFKAHHIGLLEYNPVAVDALSDNLIISTVTRCVLHTALEEAKRAVWTYPPYLRYGFECTLSEIIRNGGLPLLTGWINEPQYDGMSPEQIAAEIDFDYTPEQAIEECCCKLPLHIDKGEEQDCPACGGAGCDMCKGSGIAPQGSVLTGALLRMREIAKDVGTNTAALDIALGEILNPQVPWERELRQYFSEVLGDEGRSYHRPKRRSHALGVLLAGPDRGFDTVVIVIDVSGSVVGDPGLLEDFISEINGILKECKRPCRVILHESDVIDDFEADGLPEVIDHLAGSGGTDFRPVFELLSKADQKPPLVVFCTDLYGPLPEIEPAYPILWVVGKNHATPPWGRVLELPTQRDRRNRYDG